MRGHRADALASVVGLMFVAAGAAAPAPHVTRQLGNSSPSLLVENLASHREPSTIAGAP